MESLLDIITQGNNEEQQLYIYFEPNDNHRVGSLPIISLSSDINKIVSIYSPVNTIEAWVYKVTIKVSQKQINSFLQKNSKHISKSSFNELEQHSDKCKYIKLNENELIEDVKLKIQQL